MVTVEKQAVDWLTITGKTNLERLYLKTLADRMVDIYKAEGFKFRETHFRQYEGWSCNNLTWGEREDSCILIAMGHVADELFHLEIPNLGNPTRVDCCVDIVCEPANERLATTIATEHRDGAWIGRSFYHPILTVNMAGGETVYFGKRAGRYLLRLYDRNARLGVGELGKIWRFEVQFNSDAADAVMRLFHVKQSPYHLLCHHLVFDKWGFAGILPSIVDDTNSKHLEFSIRGYSPERTLVWLRTSVSPAIKTLIDLGHIEEVKEALGLFEQLSFLDDRSLQ